LEAVGGICETHVHILWAVNLLYLEDLWDFGPIDRRVHVSVAIHASSAERDRFSLKQSFRYLVCPFLCFVVVPGGRPWVFFVRFLERGGVHSGPHLSRFY